MARESEARPRGRPLLGLLLLLGGPAAAADALVPVARSEALWVADRGEGPPVVLLPGVLGTAFGYRRLTGPLVEAGFRALVVEPLGSGESTRPDDADYSLTAQADRLRVVLDLMAPERVVVVGQGLGVSIALRLAARHPIGSRAWLPWTAAPRSPRALPRCGARSSSARW
jgi:pimeloyl-ACP methyl ester carboxylesterase